jgi:tetratricopeptide (TPR) repeat protein
VLIYGTAPFRVIDAVKKGGRPISRRAIKPHDSSDLSFSLNRLISAGIHHLHNREFSEAEDCLRKIVAVIPKWADLHNNLGCALDGQGKLDAAGESYKQAVSLDPRHAVAHHNLGCILNSKGKAEEAVHHFLRAIALKPSYTEAYCNLGSALLTQGKLEQAAQSCRQALSIEPSYAPAHNNLGNVLRSQGKLDEAAESYQRTILLKPKYAIAHNNLACVLLEQRRLDEAIASFEKAILFEPTNADAFCNLGVALKAQGKLDQANSCFQRAVTCKPGFAEAYTNWASVLKEQQQLDAASLCCDRALESRPNFADAYCNRGAILQDRGSFEEAAIAFRRALALKPDYCEVYYNLAQLKVFHRGDADLAGLESMAADADSLPPAKKPYIHFALAKALDDIEEYPRAFEQLTQGNRIKRRYVGYDETGTRQYIQHIAEVFDATLLNDCRGMGDPSAIPIFVLGMPRTGSTLIEQILSSHPQIHGGGELKALSIAASKPPRAGGQSFSFPASFSSLNAERLRYLSETYFRGLPAIPSGKIHITDKMPANFVFIGLIHLMLPNAKIIHTVRDPVDTCVSCFSKLFVSGMPFSYSLSELGRYYRLYSQLMYHWKALLPPGTIFDVSYEELTMDLEGQARRLIDYCGLRWDAQCLQFDKNHRPVSTASNVQVRQPIFRSSVNRWHRYHNYIGPLLDELNQLPPVLGSFDKTDRAKSAF